MLYFTPIIFLIICIYAFCVYAPSTRVRRYDWMRGYFAHRGLYTQNQSIPENSMAAFKGAIQKGYGIELDLSLSKDEQLCVFHDDYLGRMCSIDKAISQLDSSKLSHLKLLSSAEGIPLFKDVLALVDSQVPLMIELKTNSHRKKQVTILKECLKDYKGKFCVVSFDPFIVSELKKQMPDVLRGQIIKNFFPTKEFSFSVRFILTFGLLNFISRPDFLSFNYHDINISNRFHQWMKGFSAVWPIESAEIENHFRMKAQIIIFEHYLPDET